MKVNNAAISIYVGAEITTIQLHDKDSSTQFVEVTLTPEQLSMALSRLAYTPCDIEVHGLDRINKKMATDKLVFEIPHRDIDKVLLFELATKNCPDGWKPDNYFNSQDSFFTKDGKQYARCTIRKWS